MLLCPQVKKQQQMLLGSGREVRAAAFMGPEMMSYQAVHHAKQAHNDAFVTFPVPVQVKKQQQMPKKGRGK